MRGNPGPLIYMQDYTYFQELDSKGKAADLLHTCQAELLQCLFDMVCLQTGCLLFVFFFNEQNDNPSTFTPGFQSICSSSKAFIPSIKATEEFTSSIMTRGTIFSSKKEFASSKQFFPSMNEFLLNSEQMDKSDTKKIMQCYFFIHMVN